MALKLTNDADGGVALKGDTGGALRRANTHPARPKTDVLDAVWLCKIAERQMLRPSFVPPCPISQLRDLSRYRIALVGSRNAEKNRVEKLLEDACIKKTRASNCPSSRPISSGSPGAPHARAGEATTERENQAPIRNETVDSQ
ncbi:IS110 family transposase [Microbacterium sp.]|uniref:IS110 family transposase n=1 Tax=Microbacterium sp. TaxID=51671 RepID=UPI003C17B923